MEGGGFEPPPIRRFKASLSRLSYPSSLDQRFSDPFNILGFVGEIIILFLLENRRLEQRSLQIPEVLHAWVSSLQQHGLRPHDRAPGLLDEPNRRPDGAARRDDVVDEQ